MRAAIDELVDDTVSGLSVGGFGLNGPYMPLTTSHVAAARLTVAESAHDADDCEQLLAALGIDDAGLEDAIGRGIYGVDEALL